MKLLQLLSILALALLLAGCAAEETALEQQAAGADAVTEPTVEQIESDLDTSPLDAIESELDSFILD